MINESISFFHFLCNERRNKKDEILETLHQKKTDNEAGERIASVT